MNRWFECCWRLGMFKSRTRMFPHPLVSTLCSHRWLPGRVVWALNCRLDCHKFEPQSWVRFGLGRSNIQFRRNVRNMSNDCGVTFRSSPKWYFPESTKSNVPELNRSNFPDLTKMYTSLKLSHKVFEGKNPFNYYKDRRTRYLLSTFLFNSNTVERTPFSPNHQPWLHFESIHN